MLKANDFIIIPSFGVCSLWIRGNKEENKEVKRLDEEQDFTIIHDWGISLKATRRWKKKGTKMSADGKRRQKKLLK